MRASALNFIPETVALWHHNYQEVLDWDKMFDENTKEEEPPLSAARLKGTCTRSPIPYSLLLFVLIGFTV